MCAICFYFLHDFQTEGTSLEGDLFGGVGGSSRFCGCGSVGGEKQRLHWNDSIFVYVRFRFSLLRSDFWVLLPYFMPYWQYQTAAAFALSPGLCSVQQLYLS